MSSVIVEGIGKVIDILLLGIIFIVLLLVVTWTMGWMVFVGSVVLVALILAIATGKVPVDPKALVLLVFIGFILLFAGFIIPQLTIGQVIEMSILKPLHFVP